MYNRELGDHTFPQEKGIAAGQSVTQEGQLLCSLLQNGVEVVQQCQGTGGEVPVGFSSSTRLLVDAEVFADAITVPSAGPYVVDLNQTNLIAGQVSISGLTNVSPGVPASGQYSVDYLNGIVTFNIAQAGLSYTIFGKHTLTVEQARTLYREGFLFNARAFEVYDVIGVIEGKGVIYTDQYDVGGTYTSQTGPLYTQAGGLITSTSGGTQLPSHVRIIASPSLSNPFLGLEFNF